MRYDYICKDCRLVFEVEKPMAAPPPGSCPKCGSRDIDRHFSADALPMVLYANRPIWTYNDARKYKTCRMDDGPRLAIDPGKHGDLGSWHCPGQVVPLTQADKKKVRKNNGRKS